MDRVSNYRYAHAEGHTDICYALNPKYIVTCGSEGDVRIWDGVNDADQKDTCVGERAWSLAQKGDNLYIGTDTNIVQAYTFPGMELDGIITRFTAPVTQIDLSPDGRTLAAGSCDMEIRVVDLTTMDCKIFIGHKAPLLSIALDPKLEYIVSSSCDATVKIWSIETKKVLKSWSTGIAKSNSFESSKSLCRMNFDRGGQLLAVPEGDKIKVYERETWSEVKTLISLSQVSVVKFSPNSRLLAAGTVEGDILVFDLSSGSQLVPYDNKTNSKLEKHSISGLAWRKDCNSLVFCNVAGQLAEFSTIRLDKEKEIQNPAEENGITNEEDIPLGVPDFYDDDDEDEDNENAFSVSKIKKETGFGDDGDFIGVTQVAEDSNLANEDSQSSYHGRGTSKIPEVKLQAAFQPSSTPPHLQERFMVWNGIGIVRQFNNEEMNDIDVEFHDTSVHHNFRMNNNAGHTMASLNSQALVLASPSSDSIAGKITCILLGARDGQREWNISLMDGEEPLGVAVGNGWVSAATSFSQIRIMTIDGTQTDIISSSGKFLTMIGFESLLAVVYHSLAGGLSYTLYSCKGMLLSIQVPSSSLPLSLGEQILRWIGFTDEGSLVTFDSSGILRIQYDDVWRPVSYLDDECKSKFDHYFVVGVSELLQTVRCILCKGTYYPQVIPKPLISEVKWKLPLCEMDVEKNQLEEEFLRSRLTVPHLSLENLEDGRKALEKLISITAMKLFALACRNNLDRRAISICEIMPSLEVVNLASKYAVKLGKQHLAAKVTDIAQTFVTKMDRVPISNDSILVSEQKKDDTPHCSKRDNYSQDMFEESQTETTAAVKENLILKMQERKKKEKDLSPKPLRIIRGGNPFKKNNESSSVQNGKTANKEDPNQGKVSFMAWYAEHKLQLQGEFPLLKESELIMAAMKKYKQSHNSLFNDSQGSESSFTEEKIETKKRKASKTNDEDSSNKKKPTTLTKLSSFSFKPRS